MGGGISEQIEISDSGAYCASRIDISSDHLGRSRAHFPSGRAALVTLSAYGDFEREGQVKNHVNTLFATLAQAKPISRPQQDFLEIRRDRPEFCELRLKLFRLREGMPC